MKCYKCETENPEGAKFCFECGAKLQAQAGIPSSVGVPNRDPPTSTLPLARINKVEPTQEERKFVTILYSDLKGYTTLSEQKDPEEVREIIKDLFSRFESILTEFQVGHHEYIGDATIALFGVPTSYPDDAERAINAGLAMQEEIKILSEKIGVVITTGVPLEIRIGINSGEVIYGAIPGKITVTGDAVNTTQRLESVAMPGKVLISSTTAKLVAGKFYMTPIPKLTLKGKKEEMIAFEVISPKKTYPSFTSPMIGRDSEIVRLKEIFEVCFVGAGFKYAPAFTVIAGDAGVGKSRLIFEFQKYLDEITPESPIPIKVAGIRCWSRATSVYQPLADLIRLLLNIRESDPTKSIMGKLEKASLPHDPLSKHFLGFFFGIKWSPSPLDSLQPDSARLSAFVTLKNFIEHLSTGQRVVIIFEDFHYADSGTLNFIKYLTHTKFRGKIMILIAGRKEGFVEEAREEKKWNFIELSPLKEKEGKALIQNYLKDKEVAEEMIGLILKKTGGNPLFLEEFAKDLRERDFALSETEVFLPDSIWALLESRIDRLPARERHVLRAASVIGRDFWARILNILIKEDVKKELAALEQKDYIYEQRPSRMINDREYNFRHDLLREATYKTILKKQRKEFHREVLGYLENSFKEGEIQPNLYFQLAAYHSELGEEYEKAVELYEKAGDNAKERYATKEAISSYSNAIDILTETLGIKYNKKIGELIRKRAELKTILAMYQEAIKDYEELIGFKDEEFEIWGLRGLASVYGRKGDFDKAIELALKARDISEKLELNELKADALLSIAQAYWKKGVYDKGLEFSESAYNIYKKIIPDKEDIRRVKKGMANSLITMGIIHSCTGEQEKALESYKESLGIYSEIDDKPGIAGCLNNMGVLYQDLGDYDKAMKFHAESLKIKREIGDKLIIANSLTNIADIYRCGGDYKMALEFHNQRLETSKEIDDRFGEATCFINIADIYGKFGDYKKALICGKTAEKIAREMGAKRLLAECLNREGEIYNEIGEFIKALDSFKEALNICEALKLKMEMCDTLYLLSQTLIGEGNTKEAEDYLVRGEEIAKKCESKEAGESILLGYAKLYLYKGDYGKAMDDSKKLLTLLEETQRRDSLFVEALWLMGKSSLGLGKRDEANKYFSRSLSLSRKMGLKPLVNKIQNTKTNNPPRRDRRG